MRVTPRLALPLDHTTADFKPNQPLITPRISSQLFIRLLTRIKR